MSFSERPPVEVDVVQIVVDALLDALDVEHFHDIQVLKSNWENTWENPRATPQEIFTKMGTRGIRLLQGGAAQVANLEAQAAILNTTAAALLGDPKYLTTALPVTVNPDGSITVEEPAP